MRKKVAAALITLSLVLATYWILLNYFSWHKKAMPVAANGSMDLSGWRFEEDGVIQLDGQWELYPDKLLSHQDSVPSAAEEGLTPAMVQVPGSWSKQMDTIGMATYRLRVYIGDTGDVYGLKTASILISNRLIVNGKVVGISGNPAEKLSYKAFNKPYVSYFTMQPGWNEIVLQMANYEFFASSGIIESLLLGKAEQIAGLRDRATAHDWIALTAFLIMGLYFLGLFSQRRNDLSLAVFGIVCVCIALFTAIPPLLLQPLVENAIRHGIGNRLEGGTVTMTALESDGQWQFVVADDGVGIAPERLKTLLNRAETDVKQGVGLLNINKRLKYEYGTTMELESEPERGTIVTVRIPASSV